MVGAEFDVAKSLATEFAEPDSNNLIFTAFGHYDLCRIHFFTRLNEPPPVAGHLQIEEGNTYRMFGLRDGLDLNGLKKAVSGSPLLALISVKLNPGPVGRSWLKHFIDIHARFFIPPKFPQRAALLAGLGHAELALLLPANSLEQIFQATEAMRSLDGAPGSAQESDSTGSTRAIFKTSTFPLFRHPMLFGGIYPDMGSCLPSISISCSSGSEGELASVARECFGEGFQPYVSLGHNDIHLIWDRDLPLVQFASRLTDFRSRLSARTEVINVSTIFRSNNGFESEMRRTRELGTPPPAIDLDPIGRIHDVNLRTKTLDYVYRWISLRNAPMIGEYYRDMEAQIESITDSFADKLLKEENSELGRPVEETITAARLMEYNLSRTVDLGNWALFQRRPHTETNILFHKQVSASFLCDIRTILTAATCVPRFILLTTGRTWPPHRMAEKRAANLDRAKFWFGFVTFGQSLSHQYFHYGQVLSYPDYSLFRPLDSWWQISHECAHHAFFALGVEHMFIHRLREKFDDKGEQERTTKEALLSEHLFPRVLWHEYFAQWFDFVYVFGSGSRDDFPFYLRCIWKSWLKIPRIWQNIDDYLQRSLAIYYYTSLGKDVLRPTIAEHVEDFPDLLRQHLSARREVIDLLIRRVRKYRDTFCVNLSLHQFYLEFLQELELDTGPVRAALNHVGPELDQQIGAIMEGEVVVEPIANPKELLVRFLRRHQGEEVPEVKSNIAMILSLANSYALEDYGIPIKEV